MRLYRYLNVAGDNDVNRFRSLGIHLVEDDTVNTEVVTRLVEQGMVDGSVVDLLDRANRLLKRNYRGKMKFDYCMEDEGYSPDVLKIDEKKIKTIKEKWFVLNDELSMIQSKLENDIRRSLHKR